MLNCGVNDFQMEKEGNDFWNSLKRISFWREYIV